MAKKSQSAAAKKEALYKEVLAAVNNVHTAIRADDGRFKIGLRASKRAQDEILAIEAQDSLTAESGHESDEQSQCGAPQFKTNCIPNDPDTVAFLKAFRRDWKPDINITSYCETYAKTHNLDEKAGARLRKYVYRHLNFNP